MTVQSPNTSPPPKFGDDTYAGTLTVRLPKEVLREFAQIDVRKAVVAIASEWLAIIGAIALCHSFWNPFFYVLAILFIGARQHALAVLQHDAAHYHLLPNKRWNDWVAETLLAWPIFISNQGFRDYHFRHHRHMGTPLDGNRSQYLTHTTEGELTPQWTFPKSPQALILWLLLRVSGLAGVIFFARSARRLLTQGTLTYRLLNFLYYGILLSLIYIGHAERLLLLYWIVPLGTWFLVTNLLRIASEHSAIDGSEGFYQLTRTTLPSWLDRIFIVPRNISYHLEHHLYPHIPFYRLPELHHCLMEQESYQQHAHITQTYSGVLQELSNGQPE